MTPEELKVVKELIQYTAFPYTCAVFIYFGIRFMYDCLKKGVIDA